MNYREIAHRAIEDYHAVQNEEELTALLTLLGERKIENVLEIGTYRGGTTWAWCQLATGKIVSLDYGDVPRSEFVGWHPHLWTPKLNSHHLETLEQVQECCREYDLLFIDGGHTYRDALLDFEMYFPLVRPGGIIAFHDIAMFEKAPSYTVKQFWKDIRLWKTWKEFDDHKDMGIGVIIKGVA